MKNGKTLNVKFMDTLFFNQREPCLLVYYEKDKGLKVVKEKQMYSSCIFFRLGNLLELKNFFISRRFQYDMELRT